MKYLPSLSSVFDLYLLLIVYNLHKNFYFLGLGDEKFFAAKYLPIAHLILSGIGGALILMCLLLEIGYNIEEISYSPYLLNVAL